MLIPFQNRRHDEAGLNGGDEKDQTIFQVIGFVGKENKIAESHPREMS
jgi:hypothetical protein